MARALLAPMGMVDAEPMAELDGAAVTAGLFHVAVKTNDLVATVAFYTRIIGLRQAARPDFGYPGAWLAVPMPGGAAILHVYAGGPALGRDGVAPIGTGAIDHVSLTCHGYHAFIARFRAAGLDWREFLVPGTHLWQLFVHDPSGVQLELTFDGMSERGARPDQSDHRRYVAGANFHDPATYPNLA
ncbi:VOC family protein [Falsiroseomonas sp. E2-1-a20]|uniref:VOC family protein n=1 Tax=Falsiroseomonas sp. E2-1-a20 TaxID=3239300 RepID=UPI003F2B4490